MYQWAIDECNNHMRRYCLDCRNTISTGSRCSRCKARKQQTTDANPKRKARKQVLYGPEHVQARMVWVNALLSGAVVCCWIDGNPITSAKDLHLDHAAIPHWGVPLPAHAKCNMSRKGEKVGRVTPTSQRNAS